MDSDSKVHAAAGLRDASEPFFSEHYLDLPIDETAKRGFSGAGSIAPQSSRCPAWRAARPRSQHTSCESLVLHGEELGYDWAFFTATSRLEKALEAHAPSPSHAGRGLRRSRSVAGELGLAPRD